MGSSQALDASRFGGIPSLHWQMLASVLCSYIQTMRGLKVQAYGFEGVMHVLHIAARIWCLGEVEKVVYYLSHVSSRCLYIDEKHVHMHGFIAT